MIAAAGHLPDCRRDLAAYLCMCEVMRRHRDAALNRGMRAAGAIVDLDPGDEDGAR